MFPPGSPQSLRVLIAEDDPLFVESLTAALTEDARVEIVAVARNGAEAVMLAETLGPDLAVIDVAMPIMDGIEAARRIRADRSAAGIVILTGEGDARREDAVAAGANAFLRKEEIVVEGLFDLVLEVVSLAAVLGVAGRDG